MKYAKRRRAAGFTLIELMVALGIMAILGALAYPSYKDAIRKSKRAEARAALLQLMQQQERYYSQNGTYLAFSSIPATADEKRFKWYSGETPAASAYEISGAPCPGDTLRGCVVLIAKPGTAKVNASYRDEACGELSFASSGMKSPSRTECW